MGLRPAIEDEERGLDDADHGEAGYHPEEISGHSTDDEAAAVSTSVPARVTP
jgi:hypothetical protein